MLERALQETVDGVLERRPRGNRGEYCVREGLDHKTEAHIMTITKPDHPDNPFTQSFSKVRNSLMFSWFDELGIRRGELAGVRVRHLRERMTKVEIVRRSDDPTDPRADQPNAKTLERILHLSAPTAGATREYILNHRRHIPGATKHDFLFVATGTGKPLSCSAINKVFQRFRERIPIPHLTAVTPHVFRHTWNDRFSEAVDSQETGMSETAEQEARSYWMGWSPTSQTAATYTKRHVREKTAKIMKDMQKKAEDCDE